MNHVIYNSDGKTTVTPMTAAKLVAAVKEDRWGECEYMFEVPTNRNTNYWGCAVLILCQDAAIEDTIRELVKAKGAK